MSDTRQLGYHFAAIPDWVLEHPDLDANATRVFGLMARFSEAFPSLAYLAERCQCSVRTIQRTLRNLEAVGAVTTTPRYREDGGRTSSLYHLAGDTPLTPASDPPRTMMAGPPRTSVAPQEVEKVLDREKDLQPPPSPPPKSAPLPAKVGNGERAEVLFAQFWAVYPRKVKKPDAFKAFVQALRGDADLAEMASGLTAWKGYWQARGEPEFVPYPATWLRAQQWNDHPPGPRHVETPDEQYARLFPDSVNGSA